MGDLILLVLELQRALRDLSLSVDLPTLRVSELESRQQSPMQIEFSIV